MTCPFCNPVVDEIVAKNDLCYARRDRYPVSEG
ncbi:HIT family protein, partial [Patescibacteria group bacterium]|nr:HIT family protein [Patescibacteria group bacterium]